jgi:hypothetical protein
MTLQRDPETLLRELAEERVPLESAEVAMARRNRVVEALGRGIREVPVARERRARRLGWISIAAAAMVALGIGFGTGALRNEMAKPAKVIEARELGAVEAVRGTLVLTQKGRARVVAPGERAELGQADSVSTAVDGSGQIRTERSVIDVAPASQVRLVRVTDGEERFHLSIGRVALRVEPRPDSTRIVVVETPDSEVVVHGTVFSVAVDSKAGAELTRVRVEEGSISVLHHGERALLTSGQEWSSAPKPKAELPAQAARVEPQAASSRSARASRRLARQNAEAADPSTLADENRMFLTAVEARNRGDDRAAVELFGATLSKYPSGKLAEEARIERMRALNRLGDDSKAAAEARRYLARHASGFARDEARATALGESASRSKP